MTWETLLIEVNDLSQVGQARREAAQLARFDDLDEVAEAEVALIATELATNLVKHGRGGHLLLRSLQLNGGGVELIACDKGPGIPNVAQAMRDGYSSAGTRGQGLGAVLRRSTEFDLTSTPGKGTAVFSRVWKDGKPPPRLLEVGAVCVRMKSEPVCGDAWAIHERNGAATVLVVDGLGHGPFAADAAREATRVFSAQAASDVELILKEIHDALKKTRGAAGALAELNLLRATVRFAGIGNISGAVLVGDKRHNMVSQNGTLGAEQRRIAGFDYPFSEGALLVMCSDGVSTHWDLRPYPGLIARHPALVAAVLHRDFTRGRDDATVVVCRRGSAAEPP